MEETIKNKIAAGINCSFIEVTDVSDGCGGKFVVTAVSDEFEGKPLLAQHRMINKLLEAERPLIHALTLKTATSKNWNKEANVSS